MPSALRVQNLWKSYAAGVRGCSARVWVLRGCAFDVAVGERVAIVGRPGTGKSTLLRCLTGERRVDAGRIEMQPGAVRLLDTGEMPPDRVTNDSAAVLLTARDVASVRAQVDRVLLLHEGRLTDLTSVRVRRVAER